MHWVRGGLTKRARKILVDLNARLIVWRDRARGTDGAWVDSDGEMVDTNIAALRNALGIVRTSPR
jgi:hypothetical protein